MGGEAVIAHCRLYHACRNRRCDAIVSLLALSLHFSDVAFESYRCLFQAITGLQSKWLCRHLGVNQTQILPLIFRPEQREGRGLHQGGL